MPRKPKEPVQKIAEQIIADLDEMEAKFGALGKEAVRSARLNRITMGLHEYAAVAIAGVGGARPSAVAAE